jgi:multisubunit Na+/H+ antiporter MnhB subunit
MNIYLGNIYMVMKQVVASNAYWNFVIYKIYGLCDLWHNLNLNLKYMLNHGWLLVSKPIVGPKNMVEIWTFQ